MKIVKILNNSLVFSKDENEEEFIVMGKGLGFNSKVGDSIDPKSIERTFIPNDKLDTKEYVRILENMPKEYLDAINQALSDLDDEWIDRMNDQMFMMLLDHIAFAIERYQDGITLQNKLLWEIQKFYPDEFNVGLSVVHRLNKHLRIDLPEEEAGNIAFHLINAQTKEQDMGNVLLSMKMLKDILNLVQYQLNIELDTHSIHYSRLVIHLQYFIQRIIENKQIINRDSYLYEQFKDKYPREHKCAQSIRSYVANISDVTIADEEVFYLMIHLVRLENFNI